MAVGNSRVGGFFALPIAERIARVAAAIGADVSEIERVLDAGGLDTATADKMVENALGTLGLPFGVALNFRVNGADYLVPMAVVEPCVVAAASHAAKRARIGGGFRAQASDPLMVAQIAVHDVADPAAAARRIADERGRLLELAETALARLVRRGGGPRAIELRNLGEGLVVLHITIDCCDAMGANLLNAVAERLGTQVAQICGGRLGLRILSNYCDQRTVQASVELPFDAVGDTACHGERISRGIVDASRFAELDPYRAVTHNKGVMNGIDAVVVATGNDWRAVEAAAHAYAARTGTYRPLSTWRIAPQRRALVGELELPLALGTVGGALRIHRGAQLALQIVGTDSAAELAEVAAAAGLASNLAALRALASEGIQRGHMALHHRAETSSGSVEPIPRPERLRHPIATAAFVAEETHA